MIKNHKQKMAKTKELNLNTQKTKTQRNKNKNDRNIEKTRDIFETPLSWIHQELQMLCWCKKMVATSCNIWYKLLDFSICFHSKENDASKMVTSDRKIRR